METTVCFIGHRKIREDPLLSALLISTIRELFRQGATRFLFGDRSAFDRICYRAVTTLQKENPGIYRVFYRRCYPEIGEYTAKYVTGGYEESICPPGAEKSRRASYLLRNRAMILASNVCVFYYDADYVPDGGGHSGTRAAYLYALRQGKRIINLFPGR